MRTGPEPARCELTHPTLSPQIIPSSFRQKDQPWMATSPRPGSQRVAQPQLQPQIIPVPKSAAFPPNQTKCLRL